MIKEDSNHYKVIYVVTIISLLLTASGLHAEERLPASKALSEKTKEFLSDRGRTGSLLGSILAGAAVANPLAPLLGSVAGFIIGKSSDYSNKDGNAMRRNAYINRSLMPEDGLEVTGLTGLTGKSPQASEQAVIAGLSGETGTGNQVEQSEQTVVTGLSMRTATGNQSEQVEQPVIVGSSGQTGTANSSGQAEQLVIVEGLSGETGAGYQSERTEQIVIVGLSGETGAVNNLQQQLTDACSNVQPTQPLPLSCYYYSQ